MTPEQLAKSGTEHGEQMALFAWCNVARNYGFNVANRWAQGEGLEAAKTSFTVITAVPVLKWIYAIPNAGARGNKVAAGQLKAEGLKSGIADICLPVSKMLWPDKKEYNETQYCGLYIELKRKDGKPSDVSDNQKEFGNFVINQGYHWVTCYGWMQARDAIVAYLS